MSASNIPGRSTPGTTGGTQGGTQSGSTAGSQSAFQGGTQTGSRTGGSQGGMQGGSSTFQATPPRKEERREGPVATAIEKQTSKMPSDWFLWGAVGSIGLSLALQAGGQKERANFVGQWAPTLLILGLYNKLVKVAGSDQFSTEHER